ncbi:hypothetical protein AU467_19305 [Mesorhizobium loti]|uniref:Uncharacterized protein n=1 Tax=Rhizobium loti TaxID=381 RepID=A0A101KTT6_RHILI|nr:hypothetical protein AU467_19305 [Mesorhizobium loti]
MSPKFLKKYILPSDNHSFVGRIYDLSIVLMHFDTYDELSKHADCKYAYDVNDVLSALTRRTESLNMVGGMLWPTNTPKNFKEFPVSRYEWLTVTADVFLVRYISVVDCAMILVNEVFECGLSFEACTMQNLKRRPIPQKVLIHLGEMISDQGLLRKERNSRFHHGSERGFSSDDQMFWIGALFEHRYKEAVGQNGRPLPIERLFREGLVELQREFNGVMRKVVKQLNRLYDMLEPEFESRFSPKFRAGPFAHRGTA